MPWPKMVCRENMRAGLVDGAVGGNGPRGCRWTGRNYDGCTAFRPWPATRAWRARGPPRMAAHLPKRPREALLRSAALDPTPRPPINGRRRTCLHVPATFPPRPLAPGPAGGGWTPGPVALERGMFKLLILLLLILLNGFFALSEMALMTSRKLRLKQMGETSRGARKALELAEHPDDLLSTVQIGITGIGVLAGMLGGDAIGPIIAGWLLDAWPAS